MVLILGGAYKKWCLCSVMRMSWVVYNYVVHVLGASFPTVDIFT